MLHRFIGLIIIIVLVIDYLEYVDYSIKSVASVNSKIYSVSNKKKHNIIKLKKRNTVPSPVKNSKKDAAEKRILTTSGRILLEERILILKI